MKAMDFNNMKGDFPVKVSSSVLSAMRDGKESEAPHDNPNVFTVRYGFRPDSLDDSSAFTLSKDKDDCIIEGNGVNSNETHVFRGQGTDAKDNEYVLVFDPQTKSFELMPIDLTLRVNRSREKPKRLANHDGNSLVLPSRSSDSNSASPRSVSPEKQKSPEVPPVAKKTVKSSTPAAAAAPSPAKPEPVRAPSAKPEPVKAPSTKPEPVKAPQSPVRPPVAKKTVKRKPAQKKPPSSSATTSRPRTAGKKPVEHTVEEEDDDDLLGNLANELEESLEDEEGNGALKANNNGMAMDEESEESDEDEDSIITLEPRKMSNTDTGSTDIGFNGMSRTGPISLRGYVGGRPEEEDVSSSEEE
ncbi:hypothetical protein TRVA0_043S00562 [Trichomonascus vanleenenianus]|uniref:uncharacterized protein n=1 Tax=Trichomonascus vanleenenianus TaxID=2268995 RepID=UPI003EC97BDC